MNTFQCIHKSWLFRLWSQNHHREDVLTRRSLGVLQIKENCKKTLIKIVKNSPKSTAPAISANVAMIHACFNVKTLAPTLVPNTLATSLAPTPKARVNASTKPAIIIHKVDDFHSAVGPDSVNISGNIVVKSGKTSEADAAQITLATSANIANARIITGLTQ